MSGPGGHPRLFLSPLILQVYSIKESGSFYLLYIIPSGISLVQVITLPLGHSVSLLIGFLFFSLVALQHTLQPPSHEANLSDDACPTLHPAPGP